LSFVMTQYLLDIIPSPEKVAREINHVLEPGGIWFSIGLSFRSRGEPADAEPWRASDIPHFLEGFGFETVEISEHRLDHLDLTDIHPDASGDGHTVTLFAARKTAHLLADLLADALRGYFRGEKNQLRQLVPRAASGKALAVHEIRSLGGQGEKLSYEINLGS